MKWFSRLGVAAAALALVACGAEGEHPEVGAQASAMKRFAPLQPKPIELSAEAPADEPADAPQPEDEAPDEVRETGFAPAPDDEAGPEDAPCLDCVRETGFVPPPILRVAEVADGFARLEWTVDDTVERVRIDATRYGSDGQSVESETWTVSGYTHFDLDLEGQRTVATVTAVDESGKSRSKPSNAVDIPAR